MKFSKRHRLVSRQDFRSVFAISHSLPRRQGIMRANPYIIYRNPDASSPRLGLSIARRVIKEANQRNRIKRCIREFFRLHREELKEEIIVRLIEKPRDFDFETLTSPLRSLLSNPSVKS